MKPVLRGLVIAAVHVGIVASLGAKLLYDRGTFPRVWALTAPYDPDLPIRGRYVSLQLVVDPPPVGGGDERLPQAVTLGVEAGRLVTKANGSRDRLVPTDLAVQPALVGDQKLWVLNKRVAFFIPEHIPDPSRRPSGETLWVEVTVPRKGPPRPIRLGVRKGDGPVAPLQLR